MVRLQRKLKALYETGATQVTALEDHAPAEHAPTAQHPDTGGLADDERFWRDAISTWQRLLLSRPQHPETLYYLKSCHAKLAEVLVLLGRPEEAAEQSDAVLTTGSLLRAATSKARSRFIRFLHSDFYPVVAAEVIFPRASLKTQKQPNFPQ